MFTCQKYRKAPKPYGPYWLQLNAGIGSVYMKQNCLCSRTPIRSHFLIETIEADILSCVYSVHTQPDVTGLRCEDM